MAALAGSLHVRDRRSASAKPEAEGNVKLGASTIVSKMQQRCIFIPPCSLIPVYKAYNSSMGSRACVAEICTHSLIGRRLFVDTLGNFL